MTAPAWQLLALSPAPRELFTAMLNGLPLEVFLPAARTPAALREALGRAELVLGDWSGQLELDAAALGSAPLLAAVVQPSVGVDRIDHAAAAGAGIPVTNCAGANSDTVAEWCLLAALAVLHRLGEADAAVRAGRWPQTGPEALPVRELAGLRVGVVGMGDIGRGVAARFAAMGTEVSYWSRTRRPDGSVPARWRELDELLAVSDVLVCVVALSAQTRGLLDAAALGRLPAGAVVVNAGRGGILDEDALVAALSSGALGGAALDVYAVEPLAAGSPLREAPNLLLSPHIAGASRQAQLRVAGLTRDNLARACSGRPLVHVVNGADPVVRRRWVG